MEAPLILTLQLDEHSFRYFDQLRKDFFPPERNFLSAHLTLFHHLPPSEPAVLENIISQTEKQEVLPLAVASVVSIGKGVAFKIESPLLIELHKSLQKNWEKWLTPQDKQKLWPHITVQNKVHPTVAKETLLQLKESFQPFQAFGLGFQLWSYEGGPWTLIKEFPFRQSF